MHVFILRLVIGRYIGRCSDPDTRGGNQAGHIGLQQRRRDHSGEKTRWNDCHSDQVQALEQLTQAIRNYHG